VQQAIPKVNPKPGFHVVTKDKIQKFVGMFKPTVMLPKLSGKLVSNFINSDTTREAAETPNSKAVFTPTSKGAISPSAAKTVGNKSPVQRRASEIISNTVGRLKSAFNQEAVHQKNLDLFSKEQ
jgi:hypothetical protein